MKLRLVVGGVALVVLGACGGGDIASPAEPSGQAGGAAPPEEPIGAWEPVAQSPLSARNNATLVWSGEEVLVFGGETFHCGGPPRAMSCASPNLPPLRDGAAYDPAEDSWRRIARAPKPVLAASTAVLGDTVYALTWNDFLSYSLAEDRWRRLPMPGVKYARLVAVGDVLVAYTVDWHEHRGPDQTWDADGERWRTLPKAPVRPVHEREMVDAGGVGVFVG